MCYFAFFAINTGTTLTEYRSLRLTNAQDFLFTAREMQEMKKVLEEMRELQEKVVYVVSLFLFTL